MPTKPPRNSIYSDEQQYLLQRENNLGSDIGQNMYGADRSTPMDAIRDLIRKHYSPNTALENKNVTAVVLRSERKAPTQLGLATTAKKDPSSDMCMLRVRVLSDRRHFWLPIPEHSGDPAIELYPYVRSDKLYGEGTLVDVDFDNDKYQFSSNMDIGSVTKVISETPYAFNGTPIEKRKRTTLPSAPAPANRLKGQALLNDIAFSKGLDQLAKDLNTDKDNLIKVMDFETGGTLDPAEQSPNSTATGLIQFIERTAKALGTTTAKIKQMSGVEQLELMKRYFLELNNLPKKVKGRRVTLVELYLTVFYPAAVGKSDDYIIGSADTKKKVNGRWVQRSAAEQAAWQRHVAKINAFETDNRGFALKKAVKKKITNRKSKYVKAK